MLTREASLIFGENPALSRDPVLLRPQEQLPSGTPVLHSILLQAPETPEGFSAAATVRQHRLPVHVLRARPDELMRDARVLRTGGCLSMDTPAFARLAISSHAPRSFPDMEHDSQQG